MDHALTVKDLVWLGVIGIVGAVGLSGLMWLLAQYNGDR